ncbi:MAG: CDP-alcohol phosphatidyltransferase family protein [candidate division Zixibacteria bacterium]|nr:CDP-alcohol phosphatidyltransferase family protein [candidate division Zixibacteria bacterium]
MIELKLLNKHWVNGFATVIEPIARFLINLRVHPHVITFSGLAISILAFNFYRQGYFFSAGVMVVLAGVCDVLDGRLARETNRMSKFGALIDSTVDRYSEVLLFLGLAVFFYDKHIHVVYPIIFAIAGSFMVSYTRARAEGLGIKCKVGLMKREERITYLAIGSLLGAIPGIGIYIVIATIWFIAIFANITVIQRVIFIRNEIKKLENK